MTEIGGHEHMRVFREPAGFAGEDTPWYAPDATVIVKVAYDEGSAAALRREDRMLAAGRGAYIGPADLGALESPEQHYDGAVFALVEGDLGESDPITVDAHTLRRAMVWLLARIRATGLRHGDLTGPNVIARYGGRTLLAADWAESHLLSEPAPPKQPWTDSLLAMRWIAGTVDGEGGLDTPRVARRWMHVLHELGADEHHDRDPLPLTAWTFLDYGCYLGDFVALAAAEGMLATGIDQGDLLSGEDSIAGTLWDDFPMGSMRFEHANVMDRIGAADVAVCFSMWPYLVQDFGRERATRWLRDAIANCGYFFFETQLAGDGPGPDFLREPFMVANLLNEASGQHRPHALVSIPVAGRAAERQVWSIRGGRALPK